MRSGEIGYCNVVGEGRKCLCVCACVSTSTGAILGVMGG